MARFDIGRVGNARQVHAAVALAQSGTQLVELRKLAIAELDFEARRALDQSANGNLPGQGCIIRII